MNTTDSMATTTEFLVRKDQLSTTTVRTTPAGAMPGGQVRVAISRFALTSNNITYAAFGDAMRYWDFFPTGNAATGCLPVWGFAEVAESRHEAVQPGERVYGYFPLADELIVQPARANAAGFLDGAEHRRALHTIYNHYARCSADPGYRAEREAEQALTQRTGGQVHRVSPAEALGRLVTLDEVGALAAFLVSPAASGMTGQTIYVDAGCHAMA